MIALLPAEVQNTHLPSERWIDDTEDSDVVLPNIRFRIRVTVRTVVRDFVGKIEERSVRRETQAAFPRRVFVVVLVDRHRGTKTEILAEHQGREVFISTVKLRLQLNIENELAALHPQSRFPCR